MRQRSLVVTGVLMIAAGTLYVCGSGEDGTPAGNPATHARIRAMTDCAALQEAFDTAAANFDRAQKGTPQSGWSVAYMKTADERMEEIGCYD